MIRIVKMTFKEEHCQEFLTHFDRIKYDILDMPGCESLRLHRDQEVPTIFFTYSRWDSDNALQHYRNSELFQKTWKKIKAWFAERAQASSVDTIFDATC